MKIIHSISKWYNTLGRPNENTFLSEQEHLKLQLIQMHASTLFQNRISKTEFLTVRNIKHIFLHVQMLTYFFITCCSLSCCPRAHFIGAIWHNTYMKHTKQIHWSSSQSCLEQPFPIPPSSFCLPQLRVIAVLVLFPNEGHFFFSKMNLPGNIQNSKYMLCIYIYVLNQLKIP